MNRTEQQDRMMAAMLAPIVADAAALGSHWIYDREEMKRRYPDGLKGFEQPVAGHYHANRKPGDNTHYGDASRLLLISVADNRGVLPTVFTQKLITVFADPEYPGFRDHAMRDMLANWKEQGKPELDARYSTELFSSDADDSADSVMSIAPVVVAYLGKPDLLQRVDTITRVRQQNPEAIAYTQAQALLLESLLLGNDMNKAVESVSQRMEPGAGRDIVLASIQKARQEKSKNVTDATAVCGASCALAKSFPAAFHAWSANPDDLRVCTLAILEAGGDSAARASMAAAWIGATQGMKSIPAEWLLKVDPDGILQDQARDVVIAL
ncbi:ADP-ribosylglycohydrolase family protein [Endozoicomonadaceae bacterium StTr2]